MRENGVPIVKVFKNAHYVDRIANHFPAKKCTRSQDFAYSLFVGVIPPNPCRSALRYAWTRTPISALLCSLAFPLFLCYETTTWLYAEPEVDNGRNGKMSRMCVKRNSLGCVCVCVPAVVRL